MEYLNFAKKLIKKKKIKVLFRSKAAKKINIKKFSVHMAKKRGFIATIRELVSYEVLDKILRYEYKYEHSYFNEKEDFKTKDGYIKFIAKTNDISFDLVANDLVAKHFNGLKTFVTFNTRLFKFVQSFQRAKPLKNVGLITKRLEGLYPKQKEFYNLTGATKQYQTIEVMNDIIDKTSTFANIFTSFVYLKIYVISMLSQINNLLFRTLFNTIFARFSRYKRKFTIFLNGFKAIIKQRKKRLRYPYKKKEKKRMKRTQYLNMIRRDTKNKTIFTRTRKFYRRIKFTKKTFIFKCLTI